MIFEITKEKLLKRINGNKLDLSNFGLDNRDLKLVIEVINEQRIDSVNFERNNLSTKGVSMLILETNLTELNITNNNITNAIVFALQKNRSLRKIYMSDTALSQDDILHILNTTPSIEKITALHIRKLPFLSNSESLILNDEQRANPPTLAY